MITGAKGGEWIIGPCGKRYLVLERYQDLQPSVVDLSNGRVLPMRDVFTDTGMVWEKHIVDVYVTYVCRNTGVRHCA